MVDGMTRAEWNLFHATNRRIASNKRLMDAVFGSATWTATHDRLTAELAQAEAAENAARDAVKALRDASCAGCGGTDERYRDGLCLSCWNICTEAEIDAIKQSVADDNARLATRGAH